MQTKKGFTLLELLIVIGILAILATTVVLVLNPVQLLKKARDSQRLADLGSLKTAIAYYITETAVPNIGDTSHTYSDVSGVTCNGKAADANQGKLTTDKNGWVPINFNGMTGGSPLGTLPHDPARTPVDANPAHYYVYLVGSTANDTFELVANMESTYYSKGGDGDVESTDGGKINTLYETGTDLNVLTATSSSCYAGDGA